MSVHAAEGVSRRFEVRKIPLLRADAGLRSAVPPGDRELAEQSVAAACVHLPAGPWEPRQLAENPNAATVVLILDGLITFEIALAGTPSAHLRGPGDVMVPWERVSDALPIATRWTVGTGGVELAVLGDSYRRAERRWPQLAINLQQRFADMAEAAAVRTAIMSLPRVEHRILALFWHLAERWGTVRPDGIRIELKLTHELIGRLAGAKRPTVSLALATLAEQDLLRSDEQGWCLAHTSQTVLSEVAARPATPGASRPGG